MTQSPDLVSAGSEARGGLLLCLLRRAHRLLEGQERLAQQLLQGLACGTQQRKRTEATSQRFSSRVNAEAQTGHAPAPRFCSTTSVIEPTRLRRSDVI